MSDWQVGDLALCVTREIAGFGFCSIVAVGRIYVVEDIYVGTGPKYDGVVALVLQGVRGGRYPGLHSGLFKKLDDHAPDEFDREVIEQMTGAPVREPAL